MKIAYSKLGRSWSIDPKKASTVGGDLDCIRLLARLAWDHPEHEFILVGRNSGEDPLRCGYPSNVVNPWSRDGWQLPTVNYPDIKAGGKEYVDRFVEHWRGEVDDLDVDHHIMWLGQHGGANSAIPQVGYDWDDDKKLTTPQMAFVNYCSYLLDFCNQSFVEPLLLCPDPRNYLKARELRLGVTRPVVAQYTYTRMSKFEQYRNWTGDDRPTFEPHPEGVREQSVWKCDTDYVYAALELTALDEPHLIKLADKPGEHTFGVISNENRKEVGPLARLPQMEEWVFSHMDDPLSVPLYGKWSAASEETLGRKVESIPTTEMYDTLRTFRSTFTMPASGSGWATAKPWEAFAAGTVMFFHPGYDDQGHILPIEGEPHWTNEHTYPMRSELQQLSNFLRVKTPEEMWEKVQAVEESDDLWHKVTRLQRRYFEAAFKHWRGGARAVEEALSL